LIFLWIGIGIVVLALGWLLLTYNRLVRLRNFVSEGWSGIDVQLRRRHDLVPNLVQVAEAYRIHEANVLTRITQTRAESEHAGGVAKIGEAEGKLQRALVELFAVAENYPDLKASDVYLNLQEDLTTVEDELQMARRYYNGTVRNLNTSVQIFPNSMVASWFRFREAEFFQIDEQARQVPQVGG
jgi:LemA protein